MRIPTPGFLFTALTDVCRRFPGTMICATLGTLTCTTLIGESGGRNAEDFLVRSWLIFQLGLPLMTALVAFSESRDWNIIRIVGIQAVGILLLAGCWFWLDPKAADFDWQRLPQYLTLLLTAHLTVSVAPYLNQRSVRDFWEYNRQLFANFVVGAAFSLILFAGLALAILAIDNLFNLDLNERIYPKLFAVIAGIFNTSYFLFHFPKEYQLSSSEGNAYNWVFRNLCKYILIPIVGLYFLILYAYGAKIGLEWSLPKGWVSSLVLGFSVAGIFTYLLNFYLAEEDNSSIVRGFKRWFWWIVLPLTLLLFIAIGRRIGDYGVTEERFLVAHLGVWLSIACLYFLFSKTDNIKFIPISLGLFALVWAFGPISAFSISERSQRGIAIQILERNGRFENGKMKPGIAALTELELTQLRSTLSYLNNRKGYSELLPSPLDSALLEPENLLRWLKIQSAAARNAQHLDISPLEELKHLDIRGFDTAYHVSLNPNEEEVHHLNTFFNLSEDGRMLEWRKKGTEKSELIELFSLGPAIDKWLVKRDTMKEYTSVSLPEEALTLNLNGKKGALRCIVESTEVEVHDSVNKLNYLNGWILLKAYPSSKQ